MAKLKRERIKELTDNVDINYSNIAEIVHIILKPYKESLSDFMKDWREIIRDRENPPTNEQIHEAIMELPIEAYFVVDGVTELSIKEDVCTALRSEIYNKINVESVGTVDERRSKAELEVLEETMIQIAYKRAKEDLKERLKLAYETLNSFKKVLNSRDLEREVSKSDTGRRKG